MLSAERREWLRLCAFAQKEGKKPEAKTSGFSWKLRVFVAAFASIFHFLPFLQFSVQYSDIVVRVFR